MWKNISLFSLLFLYRNGICVVRATWELISVSRSSSLLLHITVCVSLSSLALSLYSILSKSPQFEISNFTRLLCERVLHLRLWGLRNLGIWILVRSNGGSIQWNCVASLAMTSASSMSGAFSFVYRFPVHYGDTRSKAEFRISFVTIVLFSSLIDFARNCVVGLVNFPPGTVWQRETEKKESF